MEATKKKLTPKEAAEHAGISVALIYQLCDDRRLVHFRVGRKGRRGKILIDVEDLDAFLETCKVTELTEGAESSSPVRRPTPPPGAFSHLPPS